MRRTAAVGWLENPDQPGVLWSDHSIDYSLGEPDRVGRYMFLTETDLDGDGDLDVITSEERTIDAVVWYENPGTGR